MKNHPHLADDTFECPHCRHTNSLTTNAHLIRSEVRCTRCRQRLEVTEGVAALGATATPATA